jgi:hypothetical protein
VATAGMELAEADMKAARIKARRVAATRVAAATQVMDTMAEVGMTADP